MIRITPEGANIERRLFSAALVEDPATATVLAANGRQRFFRTSNDQLVRHDILANRFYGLNRAQTSFDVVLAPQAPDQTRPFTAHDLLRDESFMEWAKSQITDAVGAEFGGAVVGGIGGAVIGTAIGFGVSIVFPPAAPAVGMVSLGLFGTGTSVVGLGAAGGAYIGFEACEDESSNQASNQSTAPERE